jgi:hypothetical protein
MHFREWKRREFMTLLGGGVAGGGGFSVTYWRARDGNMICSAAQE